MLAYKLIWQQAECRICLAVSSGPEQMLQVYFLASLILLQIIQKNHCIVLHKYNSVVESTL